MQNLNIQQIEQKIKQLIKLDELNKAYTLSLEILKLDPRNFKFINLKNQIEQKAKKQNEAALQQELQNLKPIYQKKDYEKYLNELKKLQTYYPNNSKITNLIFKINHLAEKQILKRQLDFIQNEFAIIKQLKHKKQFEEAKNLALKIQKIKPNNKKIKKIINQINHQWINNEININKNLLNSNKTDQIELFLLNLFKIEQGNKKIKKLLLKNRKKIIENRIEDKKDFIYKNLEEINIMFTFKQYDKIIDHAEQILNIDPKNHKAWQCYKKASFLLNISIHKEINNQIKQNFQKIKKLINKIKI